MDQMIITFPGGKRVDAAYRGFTVRTDQPPEEGGEGSAPEPYDLLPAALGTCTGVYLQAFCAERGIDPRGLTLTLAPVKNEQTHLFERITVTIGLPPGFPPKYAAAVARVAGMCTVKRSLAQPPECDIVVQSHDG
jgi:putative redox protein